MSVSTNPGETAFTRMPLGASSRAIEIVSALIAPFEDEYGMETKSPPVFAAPEVRLTIAASFFIFLIAYFIMKK